MLQIGMKVKGQIMQDFRNCAPSFSQNRDVGRVVTEGGRRLSRGMITGAKDLKPKRLLGKQAKLENISAKLELPCKSRT